MAGTKLGQHVHIARVGGHGPYWRDLYASLLKSKWRTLLALAIGLYFVANVLFAAIFLLFGDCIQNAEQGSFLDAFFFSVQTLSTIGYGVMTPKGVCGNMIVSIESLTGIIVFALGTGIVFAKFGRPTAGILFSDKAIIANRNGRPCLMFRVANSRGSDIVEASIRVTALVDEETQEGDRLRRLRDLKLERQTTPLFLMSWLVIHPIDEFSPLHEKSIGDFEHEDIRIITSMTGIDGTFMQTVFSYHTYTSKEILEGHRFRDVVERLGHQKFRLNLKKFHQVEPIT